MKFLRLIAYALAACVGGCLVLPTAWGQALRDTCNGDSIVISSIPFTITLDDTCYCITGNVTGTGNGITIQSGVNNTLLTARDPNGDTVFFGTTDANAQFGLNVIGIGGATDYINIKHMSFIHNPNDSTSDSTYSLILDGPNNILFDTCNFHVVGHKTAALADKAHAVYRSGNANELYNVHFRGGNYTAHVVGFRSRSSVDGQTMHLIEGGNWLWVFGEDYHFKFEDINVTGAGGIAVKGRVLASYDTIIVDQRNDRYTFPSGDGDHGFANQAAFGTQELVGSCRLHHLYIHYDSSYGGLDEGIFIQSANANTNTFWKDGVAWMDTSSCGGACDSTHIFPKQIIQIDSNEVYTSVGKDPGFGWGLLSKAFKMRWGNDSLWIFDNIFVTYVGDTTSGWSGRRAAAFYMVNAWPACDFGPNCQETDSFNIIENNFIQTIPRDSTFHEERTWGAAFAVGNTDSVYSFQGAGNIWRYNTVEGPTHIYGFGFSDGECDSMVIIGDTINQTDSTFPKIITFQYSYWFDWVQGDDNDGNRIQDCFFTDGDLDTNMRWQVAGAGTADASLERTVELFVKGSDGFAVENATTWMVDAYADSQSTGTTDANGLATALLRYWREFKLGGDGADSTAYNNFTIGAAKDGDTTTHAFTVAWDNYNDTITLSATLGGSNMVRFRSAHLKGITR